MIWGSLKKKSKIEYKGFLTEKNISFRNCIALIVFRYAWFWLKIFLNVKLKFWDSWISDIDILIHLYAHVKSGMEIGNFSKSQQPDLTAENCPRSPIGL